jgi:TolA-binding protein
MPSSSPACWGSASPSFPAAGLVFGPGEQPDKVLYQKATHEVAHARFEVGRLTLQTLINTYPDSEYLSKAKLAIADSYYAEGGVSGFTQAEAEYKDFITFFPTAPEAPEAQFHVGMAHFRLMAKADRDQTEALLAETEFKEFLLKYPDSPLISRVKGRREDSTRRIFITSTAPIWRRDHASRRLSTSTRISAGVTAPSITWARAWNI